MSQETSHSSSRNMGSIFDIDGRGGYRYHASHFTSHNPGYDERICICRSKDNSHCSYLNHEASFDGYGRAGYRFHIRHSLSHNPGGRGIFLGFSIASSHVFTSHLPSHNCGVKYISPPALGVG